MSGIPADRVAQASTSFDAVQIDGSDVYWIEGRPGVGDVLMRWTPTRGAHDVLPPGTEVASYVHEYGGGAYLAAHGRVWYCDAADQRIYRGLGADDPAVTAVTAEEDIPVRYADLRLSADRRRLVCVRERHLPDGVVNELVTLPADGSGPPVVLASGWDFYSSPRPSPDGRHVAWLCWNAPAMPWDGTWLYVADWAGDSLAGEPTLVAGGTDESVFQPEWSPDGVLHLIFDRSGWWNLYAWHGGHLRPVLVRDAELGVAQWEFGYATYAFLDRDHIAVIVQAGPAQHVEIVRDGHRPRRLDLPYTSIKPYLSGRGSTVALIASDPTHAPGVFCVDIDSADVRPLSNEEARTGEAVPLTRPQPFTFPTRDGGRAHGLYHAAPRSAEAPPLIVKAHPGPTANAPLRLDWHTQYFASRGWAVAEIEYRGSTGYGRAYRQALRGQWGLLDAWDCADAVTHLTTTGLADAGRVVIWGASAGGYTALRALSITDAFTAAIVRCPVVDPATWRRAAPKFQTRHTDGLIGPWPENAKTYQERSVLEHADEITRPVLILHREDDPITPIGQSHALAAVVGPNAQLIIFPGEGHTLRGPDAMRRALEAELAFLERSAGNFDP